MASLVELNIWPEECARKGGNAVAPGLVEKRRRVIRERLKDGLRVWVEQRAVLMQSRKEEEKAGVKGLVRRFTRSILEEKDDTSVVGTGLARQKKKAQMRWGNELEVARKRDERSRAMIGVGDDFGGCSQPTRAHVLGLRRFWEGVIKTASG